jgi:hypothetical protein
MSNMDWSAWCVIIGLSAIAMGGLVLWAYGDSIQLWLTRKTADNQEALSSRRRFTGVLIYSAVMIVVGFGLLVQGSVMLLHP